jgi:DNA-binding MarR family transcriptional regulator
MEFIQEEELTDFVNTMKYLVIYPDASSKLYKSLRDIAEDICVDSSTISKKLAGGENIVKAKGTEYIFYIKKLD